VTSVRAVHSCFRRVWARGGGFRLNVTIAISAFALDLPQLSATPGRGWAVLAGSLVLGFLDLQSGQAQNRFYTELQDLIATDLRDLVAPERSTGPALAPVSGDLRIAIERLREAVVENGATKTASAMANLAIAIDGLLSQMRSDQKLMREWIGTQAEQQRDIHRLLETVVHEDLRE